MPRIPGAIGRGYLPKGGRRAAIAMALDAGEKWRCRGCNKSGLKRDSGGLCPRCKKVLHVDPVIPS